MKKRLLMLPLIGLYLFLISCSHKPLHNGHLPFALMETAPSKRCIAKRTDGAPISQLTSVLIHPASADEQTTQAHFAQLQPGDLIAFHMSHHEAWTHLNKAQIAKLPYELFRYGHLALLVPDPENPLSANKTKLLQVAMKQAINTTDDFTYLKNKNWIAFRPPSGSIDPAKLQHFAKIATQKGHSAKKAYDYTATIGLPSKGMHPNGDSDISKEYTCCTLSIAALHYSGYTLHAKRKFPLDIITPAQVIKSQGTHNQLK